MPDKTDHLAVLFADIVESTSLYRRLGDVEALRVVSTCLDALRALLPRHRGRLVKLLGDAVMCLFPDADCAVEAAMAMQREVVNLRPGGLDLQIRIGLHTGPVVVGGEDVYGDTVNVAAYLADTATPGQILIAESTSDELTAVLRESVFPIFDAVLKTTLAPTAVCEVRWRDDFALRTHINLHIRRSIPEDAGSMVLEVDGRQARVDHWHPILEIGRAPESGLVVAHALASRRHASIRLDRTQFYLVDHSTNGTFVTRSSGEEIHIVRREIMLEVRGEIRAGFSRRDGGGPCIEFSRDRRSLYRV